MTDERHRRVQGERGSRDWFLQELVRLANEHPESVSLPVTLCVNGLLVSGVIVSGQAYFEGFADTLATAVTNVSDDSRWNIRQMFAQYGEFYKPKRSETAAGRKAPSPEAPEFIHLRNAQFFIGSNLVPTDQKVWWRGRIAEVDGFMLGVLGPPHVGRSPAL
jgi:hypothetical protein